MVHGLIAYYRVSSKVAILVLGLGGGGRQNPVE